MRFDSAYPLSPLARAFGRGMVGGARGPLHGSRPVIGCRRLWLLAAIAGGLLSAAGRADGQLAGRAVPRPGYYLAIAELYRGDYRRAERDFRGELRGAIKTVQSHWIDSICHHTMLGECYYMVAQYDRALEHYDTALKLYLAFPNWMLQVKFPPSIAADANVRRAVPWGPGERPIRPGRFSDTMLVMQGRVDNSNVVRQGGVVQMARYMPVNVAEIVRCTSLAMWRRRQLMGPVARHDALTDELVAVLSRRPGRPNHWSEAWIDVQLGLAHAMKGDAVQAQQYLTRSLLVGGTWDHPLTGHALLALGELAWESGDFQRAIRFFDDASRSAYYFDNYVVIEEAMRMGLTAHLMAAPGTTYAPLAPAVAWAQARRARHLEVAFRLLVADNALTMRQTQAAQTQLNDARALVGRRDLSRGVLGTRLKFLSAAAAYQLGRGAAARDPLDAALSAMHRGSKWLFQIHMADRRYVGSDARVTPRIAMQLYGELLRDPAGPDWARDPLETLAVLVTPHRGAYEHWFEAALKRKEMHRAIEIADRARRHRFFTSLPLGGRLTFLRTILETPADRLPRDAALQREGLLVKYPAYRELAEKAGRIRRQLEAGPLLPDDPQQRAAGGDLWRRLADVSGQQERWLREMALSRVACDAVFPPLVPSKQVQERLPDGQALLVWFETADRWHGFLLTNSGYRRWAVGAAKSVRRGVARLLREMGNFDAHRPVPLATLGREDWKAASQQVVAALFEDSKVDLTRGIDELVIVPDGILWYLPFEALVVGPPPNPPLITRMRIRYAPTVGLTQPLDPRVRSVRRTAVVADKLFPRGDGASAATAYEEIAKVAPGAVRLSAPLPAPSPIFGALIDRLIVFEDIELSDPRQWAPLPLDQPVSTGALGNWFPLPWGGPRQVVLPGFRTAAETALKRHRSQEEGDALFLSVCGLMSCGARTVLLSRWRTGGQSSVELVREFVQELPHAQAADAWQRSVELCMVQPIQPQHEPRVGKAEGDRPPPVARHPFLWSGYLLVDTGASPTTGDDEKENRAEPAGAAAVRFPGPPGGKAAGDKQ